MAFDQHANLAIASVAVAPVPALTGTSLTVTAGFGALFPTVPFNCTVYPSASTPISTNAEIVRVTNVAGDVLTITRAQEGTVAMPIAVGYLIANTITKLVFTDIENAMVKAISAAGGSASGGTILFDNSPTVSFGRAGQTITASAAGGGGGMAISAGANSQSTGTVIFSNSNSISFGLVAGTLTASFSQTVQPVAASASNGSFNFSTLNFSNANGVTFGTSAGGIITASAAGAAQSTQPVAASASNGSFLFSTVAFSNANGVTFGTSAGSIISASVLAQTVQPVAVSNSAGSFLFSTLNFSNANNVTFGTSAGNIVTASVAAQTVQPVAVSNSAGSFLFSTLNFSNANNVTFGTSAGNIVTASVAAQTVQPVAFSDSAGSFLFSTLNFSNANNVTFGTSAGNIVTASVAATVAQTNQTGGIYVTAQSTGQSSSSTYDARSLSFVPDGIISAGWSGGSFRVSATQSNQNVSAPNGSFNFQTFVFSNSNNVSWSTTAGSGIVASVTVASTQASVVFGAVGSTNTGSQMIFSNSNNVTFGLNASTITASVTVASTQASIVVQALGSTNTVSVIRFSNLNGVSFGLNASTVTASVASYELNVSAGTTSGNIKAGDTLVFSNGSNVSFGFNVSTVTASVATSLTNVNVSAGTTSNNLSAMTFGNGGGITFGLNGSVITAAAPAGAPSPVNISAGTTSDNLGSVVFSNSNAMSFGLNGSTITASFDPINIGMSTNGNTAGTTGTFDGAKLQYIFAGGNGITLSQSSNVSSVTLSIVGNQTSSLVGTGGLTMSSNGSTISVSLLTANQFEQNFPAGTDSTTWLPNIGSWLFQPLQIPFPMSGGRWNLVTQFGSTSQLPRGTTSASWGSNTSGQKAMRYQYSCSAALYSIGVGTNSTRLESQWSNQHSFEISHNVSISGNAGSMTVSMGVTLSGISNIDSAGGVTTTTYGGSSTLSSAQSTINSTANSSILSSVNNMLSGSLMLPIPFNTTINAGVWYLGLNWSTASSTTGSSQVGFAVVNAVGQIIEANIVSYRMFGQTVNNNSSAWFPGHGQWSVASAAPPATIAFSDLRAAATNAEHYLNWCNSVAITI